MESYDYYANIHDITTGRGGLCPHCNKETGWVSAWMYSTIRKGENDIVIHICQMCGGAFYDYCLGRGMVGDTLAYGQVRIWPDSIPSSIPQPNADMPDICKKVYEEAAHVFVHSHRAAAALLRLCLQQLLTEAGIQGNTIDRQIQNLIKSGEDPMNVLCMDICRILGNESVHPGTINLNEDTETATILFMFINMATDRLFTAKRRVEELYQKLPEEARKALEARNARLTAENAQES